MNVPPMEERMKRKHRQTPPAPERSLGDEIQHIVEWSCRVKKAETRAGRRGAQRHRQAAGMAAGGAQDEPGVVAVVPVRSAVAAGGPIHEWLIRLA
jgi:hypothetical protein